MAEKRPFDVTRLPEPLRAYASVFEEYGVTTGDDDLYAKVDEIEADPAQLARLNSFAHSWTPEKQRVCEDWLSDLDLTESPEAAQVYFFFMLADALTLEFPREAVSTIDKAVSELASRRRQKRMWAARTLAQFGPRAVRAVEALEAATGDDAPEVAAWAHAALAAIQGNPEDHREVIRQKIKESTGDRVAHLMVGGALDDLSLSPDVRRRGCMTSACILGDIDTVRDLISEVDVNARDHNGQSAIQYAIGNDHPDVVRLLLEAGADPNTCSRHGTPVLHDAAARRLGLPMVDQLLRHGADPNARNREGETALAIALACRRHDNAKRLRGVSQ